jgi:hypothetical protein
MQHTWCRLPALLSAFPRLHYTNTILQSQYGAKSLRQIEGTVAVFYHSTILAPLPVRLLGKPALEFSYPTLKLVCNCLSHMSKPKGLVLKPFSVRMLATSQLSTLPM